MLLSTSRKRYYWVQITSPWEGQTGTVMESLSHDTLWDSGLILATNFRGRKPTPRKESPHPNSSAQTLFSDRSLWRKKIFFLGGRAEPQPTCLWCCSFLLDWFFWNYFTHINRPRQRAQAAKTTVRYLLSTWQTAPHLSVYPVNQIQSSLNARGGMAPDPKWGILGARVAQGSQQAHKPSQFEGSLIAEIGGC